MDPSQLRRRAVRTLRASADRLGWTGDLDDQANDLLVHVLGREPQPDEDISPQTVRRFDRLVARRATGEPLAYILGWTEFRDLRLRVQSGVFVPRATSEFLVDQTVRRLRGRRDPVHVDLATGAGPVALAVGRAVSLVESHGTDLAADAVRIARRNARELGIPNAHFHQGDMYAPLPRRLRGQVDVVTIHPPYVPRGEIRDLPAEIRRFEPRHTLTDRSVDGLRLVRRTAEEGWDWLCAGGWVLVEVMPAIARAVKSILVEADYEDVRSTQGPMRWTRVVVGRATG